MKSIRDDCILIENSLALWVGGDLETELCARVDQHLAQCERCDVKARFLAEARRALISGLRAPGPRDSGAPDLWPNLEAVLRREGHFAPRREAIPTGEGKTESRWTPETRTHSYDSKPHQLRRQLRRSVRFGLAAAAAVMVGFLLGRLGSDGPSDPDARAHVSGGPTHGLGEAGHPGELVQAPSTVHPAVPVSDRMQLRRLAPGEPRLQDIAENFGGELSVSPSAFGNPSIGSPASLQSVQPRRW